MKTIFYPADSRGYANHGWLKTSHTFSFANYYNPERIHFGALRVLNDDWIAAGEGFGKHPHDNMEIITIPFTGAVLHQDSMGNKGVILPGEIQVMSAGTGIFHSEHNNSKEEALTLFQIWVFPDKKNVTPRYDQITISDLAKKDELYQILSPNADDEGVWIHQKAWFHLGDLSKDTELDYTLKQADSGVFIQVIDGNVKVGETLLDIRDAIGITETETIHIKAETDARILVMEVPMKW
ncbi:MAG: pirin family protein [Paludibacter sp.]|nr:pirin family protein [Paludibacter sp.]